MTTDTDPQDSYDLGNGVLAHHGLLTPELVPHDKISPHPENPRNGDTDAIGDSITANRLYDVIKVQRSTGFILSGNHTYAALVERGAEQIPVVYLDVDDDEALRVLLSANATHDRGGYDEGLYAAAITRVLEAAGDQDAALRATGLTETTVLDMVNRAAGSMASAGTDFLSGFGQTPGHDPEEPPAVGTDGTETYYAMTYTVNGEDRDTIRAALKLVGARIATPETPKPTSAQALVALAKETVNADR